MIVNSVRKISDITDGNSNTLVVCEDAGRPDIYRGTSEHIAENNPSSLPRYRVSGAGWADDENEFITHGFTLNGHASPGTCHTNCTNNNEVYAFHPGGANMAFADGSVRFIKQSANIRVYCRLIMLKSGEVISADQY